MDCKLNSSVQLNDRYCLSRVGWSYVALCRDADYIVKRFLSRLIGFSERNGRVMLQDASNKLNFLCIYAKIVNFYPFLSCTENIRSVDACGYISSLHITLAND